MPQHRNIGSNDETREYPVTSDTPVRLTNPLKAVRVTAIAYAAAIVICSAAAAWIATVTAHERAKVQTERRVQVLERDLTERRKAAAEANARRDAQLAEAQRIVCVIFDRLPRDAQVEMVRARFQCDRQPSPGLSPTPAPSATPPAAGTDRGQGQGAGRDPPRQPRGTSQPGRPAPTPNPPATPPRRPDPAPTRPPDPPPKMPVLCLPLLGCVL